MATSLDPSLKLATFQLTSEPPLLINNLTYKKDGVTALRASVNFAASAILIAIVAL